MTENNEEEIDYSAYAYNRQSNTKDRREFRSYDNVDIDEPDRGDYRDDYARNRDYIDVTSEMADERNMTRVDSLPVMDMPRITTSLIVNQHELSAKETNTMSIISKSIARLELPNADNNSNNDSYDSYNNDNNSDSYKYDYNRNASGDTLKTSRKKRTGKSSFAIALISVIICFGLVVVIADAMSGGYIIDKAVGIFSGTSSSETYYAVEIASFDEPNAARLISNEVRAGGAGGYVVNDGLYRVIAEVYPNKSDALSVSAKLNLNGYVTSIYEIRVGEVNYSVFPTSTRTPTRDVLKYADLMYDSLFEIAANIDDGKYDFNAAKGAVKELGDRVRNMLIDYDANADGDLENENVHKVRMQISAVVGALDNISTESTSARDMASDVRYINCMILNTHSALVAGLSDGNA